MFKKKNKDPDFLVGDISRRIRGFIMDSQIQNGHELTVILGGSPMSDEVQEREEEESDKRLAKISYLVPLVYAQVHLLAEGAVEYQKSQAPKELKSLPDEVWWESRKMMEQVSISAVMGSISQLIDMGLLEVPKKYKER